jgi:ERCC4-type nuclease
MTPTEARAYVMVDDRTGSGEVAPILRGLNVPVKVERMDSADFAFEGSGPHGSMLVGIERKKVKELIQSIETGRFEGDQLPKMLKTYEQSWLIVEGVWRPNPQSGVLEEWVGGGWRDMMSGRKGFAFCQLDNFLTSLQARVHLMLKYTSTVTDTAHTVKGMWQWYRKPWGQHKSGLVIYTPPPPAALFLKPNLVRRWANSLDGIGWEKSAAVAAKFQTGLDLAVAQEQEWITIPGIGKGLAVRAVRQILGQEGE